MMSSHQAPSATPYTITPSEPPHHIGHQEYGGKKPSPPAPSAISASFKSSGRGSICEAWKARDTVTMAISKVVITSAEVPVHSPESSQYNGETTTKNAVAIAKIQASILIRRHPSGRAGAPHAPRRQGRRPARRHAPWRSCPPSRGRPP